MTMKSKKTLRYILIIAGIILVLISIIKFSVIGFYPSEVPLYFIILVAGAACLIIAQKIKLVKPGEDKSGLGLPGKWKCDCGAFCDNGETFCGNCRRKRS
jgi:hypothetical protein